MTQEQLTFGKLIRQVRIEQGLTLQELAGRRFGLEAATISRSENEQSQVTLLTAVRICQALGLSIQIMIERFIDESAISSSNIKNQKNISIKLMNPIDRSNENNESKVTPLIYDQNINESTILMVNDVKKFILFHSKDTNIGNTFLTDLLNRIVHHNNIDAYEFINFWGGSNRIQRRFQISKPYTIAEVERLVGTGPISQGIMFYPDLTPDIITMMYDHGGALISEDARHLVEMTLQNIQSDPSLSHQQRHHLDQILQRVSHTSVERIKFADIVELDKLLKKQGELLRGYWQAALIIDEIQQRQNDRTHPHRWPPEWEEAELSLATLYIVIVRWLQLLGVADTKWLQNSMDMISQP